MVFRILRHTKHHSSDITDSQWMLIQGILRDNNKRKHSLQDIFNAFFYLLKTSADGVCCQAVFQNGSKCRVKQMQFWFIVGLYSTIMGRFYYIFENLKGNLQK